MLHDARSRAKQCNLPYQLSLEWLENKLAVGVCEVTGITFKNERGPYAPSLDQRIPGAGYTLKNTQVVVRMYNTAKGDWTHEDVLVLAKALQ